MKKEDKKERIRCFLEFIPTQLVVAHVFENRRLFLESWVISSLHPIRSCSPRTVGLRRHRLRFHLADHSRERRPFYLQEM